MMSQTGSNRGAVLLEAVLAIVILSISIAFVMQGFMSSMKAIKTSEGYVKCAWRLDEKMWEIEDEAMKGALTTGVLSGVFDDGVEWSADISDTDYEALKELKLVKLTVSDKSVVTYVKVEEKSP